MFLSHISTFLAKACNSLIQTFAKNTITIAGNSNKILDSDATTDDNDYVMVAPVPSKMMSDDDGDFVFLPAKSVFNYQEDNQIEQHVSNKIVTRWEAFYNEISETKNELLYNVFFVYRHGLFKEIIIDNILTQGILWYDDFQDFWIVQQQAITKDGLWCYAQDALDDLKGYWRCALWIKNEMTGYKIV